MPCSVLSGHQRSSLGSKQRHNRSKHFHRRENFKPHVMKWRIRIRSAYLSASKYPPVIHLQLLLNTMRFSKVIYGLLSHLNLV